MSARTQADRDLVALVYSGLVRNGPSGSLVPDLAERWTVDSTGSVWTFYLRDDARWHDGEPVTAEDVAFTIGVLQDPKYTGPGAGSWNEVTVATQGALTVVFTLKTPLGGFLQAATQPIAPAHILAGIPADQLPDRPFGRQPIGSGPFAVASLSNDTAELIPAGTILPPDVPGDGTTPVATDSLATPGPASPPARPVPYLNGMEFQFFDDPEKLAVAYRDGKLDAVSGLSPTMTRDLGQASDSKVLRYPGSTLTAVLLNLRPGHPEFANPAVRAALLAAIDRPQIVTECVRPVRRHGDERHPSVVVPVRPDGRRRRSPYDPAAAQMALAQGRLDQQGRWLASAQREEPAGDRVAQSRPGIEPRRLPDRRDRDRRLAGDRARRDPRAAAAGRVRHGPSRTGKFSAAVGDVTIGLDPDLYPLLASSQTVTGGSNVIGLQDPAPGHAPPGRPRSGHADRADGRLFGAPEAAGEGPLRAAAGLRRRVDRGPRHAPGSVRQPGRRPG